MFIVGNVGSDWNGPITAPGLFDGFNIDWEFPTAADKQNFTALLQEFRRQLNALSQTTGKKYLLTADSPAGSQNYVNIDLPQVAKVLDFVTIDGYTITMPDRGTRSPITLRRSSTPGKIRTMGRDSTSKTPSLRI